MTPTSHRRFALTLLLLVVAFAGCATGTKISEHWRDPSWKAAPLGNVYVVAIRKEAVRRRMWEDGFVAQLKERGVQATPSYAQFPDAAPDTQQVIDAVSAGGYDGVLVSLRLPNTQEQREVLPTTTRVAETRRNPYTGFYYTAYRDVYTPGYTETDEIRRYQTDVYATKNGGSLIWSASVQSYDPIDAALVKAVVEKKVLPQATKDRIFPERAK